MMIALFVGMVVFAGAADDRPLIQYFLDHRTKTGLVLDRDSNPTTVSCAGTGFGMNAWAIAAERNIVSKETALEYIQVAFEKTVTTNPVKNRGWLYHFTDGDGNPRCRTEVSTIDTALFYLNAEQAGTRIGDSGFLAKVRLWKSKIDIPFMMHDHLARHGCYWSVDDKGAETIRYIGDVWDESNEGVLFYRCFGLPYAPTKVRYDLPLFVYFYPLCFFDDPELVDRLRKAVDYQKAKYGYWGFTACDGPKGYQSWNPKIISPVGIWATKPWVTDADARLNELGLSPLTCATHIETKWVSKDKLAIDYGSCLVANAGKPKDKAGLFRPALKN
jgi:hypothetical protein